MADADLPELADLMGQVVVLDLSSPYVYVGRLARRDHQFLVLEDVDAHDLRDATSTREQYVVECRRLGPTANRRMAWVRIEQVVGISRLDDVTLH